MQSSLPSGALTILLFELADSTSRTITPVETGSHFVHISQRIMSEKYMRKKRCRTRACADSIAALLQIARAGIVLPEHSSACLN